LKTLKRIFLTAAFLALTAFAIYGTLGDDTKQADYVAIENVIQQRNAAGELIDFVTDRELLVTTGELTGGSIEWSNGTTDTLYTNPNVVDKFVSLKNTGNVDAYVRTWFAFEMGDLTEDEFEAAVVLKRNIADWTWGEIQYGVVISGQRYAVVCAEYVDAVSKDKKALPAGETTAPSLLQVMLRNTVSNETAERLDGNSDGKYEIKVTSRIVSDAGAWGALTGHPFPTVVTTAEELQNAINSGAENIILGENLDLGGGIIIN